jgi:hypothetical protein
MTTEDRLANLERELARAKRRNRWLVAVVGVAGMVLVLAWTLEKTPPTVLGAAVGGTSPPPRVGYSMPNRGDLQTVEEWQAAQDALELAQLKGMHKTMMREAYEAAAKQPDKELRAKIYQQAKNTRFKAQNVRVQNAFDLYVAETMPDWEAKFAALEQVVVGTEKTVSPPIPWKEDGPTQAASGVAKVIRANAFILEDAGGNMRAMLGVDKNGPKLSLFDDKGKTIWQAP